MSSQPPKGARDCGDIDIMITKEDAESPYLRAALDQLVDKLTTAGFLKCACELRLTPPPVIPSSIGILKVIVAKPRGNDDGSKVRIMGIQTIANSLTCSPVARRLANFSRPSMEAHRWLSTSRLVKCRARSNLASDFLIVPWVERGAALIYFVSPLLMVFG